MNVDTTSTAQTVTGLPEDGSGSTRRLPLLVPLLIVSLTVHAAVVGLWPVGNSLSNTPMTAGPISVRLQTNQATDAQRDRSQTSTAASPPPATAAKQLPVGNRITPNQQPIARATATASAAATASTVVAAVPSSVASTPTVIARQSNNSATADATDSDNATAAQVNSSLKRALIAHFDYPTLARRRGWEGVVRIGVRVEANGYLSGLRVIASSGHALLDRAALSSLREVGRLNDTAQWLNGNHFDMVLPVHYRLIDSWHPHG